MLDFLFLPDYGGKSETVGKCSTFISKKMTQIVDLSLWNAKTKALKTHRMFG